MKSLVPFCLQLSLLGDCYRDESRETSMALQAPTSTPRNELTVPCDLCGFFVAGLRVHVNYPCMIFTQYEIDVAQVQHLTCRNRRVG